MSLYVYRRKSSTSARALARALEARRVFAPPRLQNGDTIVCWGEELTDPLPNSDRVLNGGPIRSKLGDIEALTAAGVRTVEAARQRPAPIVLPAPVDPAIAAFQAAYDRAQDFVGLGFEGPIPRDAPLITGVAELQTAFGHLFTLLRVPAPVAPAPADVGEWLGRRSNHVGGSDLLAPPAAPDYYVKKLDLVREFRVHSFAGRSIRAGIKVIRDDFRLESEPRHVGDAVAHPWVRSWDAGWRIAYDGESVRQAHRDLAHRAVTALGLTFGAVDIGEIRGGGLVVLEVNRAPGLEGGTIEAYAEAIQQWIERD